MKYYCIRQHDSTDCGAACIATISKQNGLDISISKIREVAGTDVRGTTVYGIIKAAKHLGFSAKAVEGKEDALLSGIPLPCIAHVVTDGHMLHYVVVQKITKKHIIISDPAKGVVKLTHKTFLGKSDEKVQVYKWTGVLVLICPNQNFKKGRETKGMVERFFYLLIPQRNLMTHVFLASLVYTCFGIIGAFYYQALLDSILPDGLRETLITLSIAVIALNIFKVLLGAFRSHLMLYLSQRLDVELLLGYYRHVLKLPMSFFGTRKVGEIVSRFNDASKVRDAISGATLTIMIDTIMAIAGAIILYMQNAKMFAIAVLIVILYGIIVAVFDKSYKKMNQRTMEDNAQLTSYLVESLNGMQTIKAYNAERKAEFNTEKRFVKLLRSIFKLSWIVNIQESLKGFVECVGGVVILWIGAVAVINGELSSGQLIVFNSLLAYFLDPIKNLINLQPQIKTAVVAAERLGEILDLESERTDAEYKKMEPKRLWGDIVFEHVNFRYGARRLVLEDIDIKIPKGSRVAFVGESGSGKTTLSKLLLHFYEVEEGNILIDENNIDDIKIDVLRDKIAYISQETFLFSGTIMENLTLGMDKVTTDEVIEACKMAQAHEFINDLPLRYETLLEENGANLSGGQRQRLAIARAMLKKPDILILDEATSNLDAVTERAIDITIKDYCKNMTTIFIAHRLSTIKDCDIIFVLEKGKVIEQGTHEELKKLKGKYSILVNQQSLEKTEKL